MIDPANLDPAYDADRNAYESWKLAIRETRLSNIRKGTATPRSSHPEEMAAWREGQKARRAMWAVIGGVFALVAVLTCLSQETAPAGRNGAAVYGFTAGQGDQGQ